MGVRARELDNPRDAISCTTAAANDHILSGNPRGYQREDNGTREASRHGAIMPTVKVALGQRVRLPAAHGETSVRAKERASWKA